MIYNIKLWYHIFLSLTNPCTFIHAKGNLSNFTASIHPLNQRDNRTPNHAYEEYAQFSTCLHCDSRFVSFHFPFFYLFSCCSFVCLTSHVQMRILNLNLCEGVKENLQNDSFGISCSRFILFWCSCCWCCYCLLLFLSMYFHLFSCTSGHYKWIVVLDITCWQIKYGSLFMHRIEWNTTDRQQTCYVDCPL